ncbi:MAG: DNA replication/repair protein RecF [Nitrospinota bacterium]
MLKGRRRYCTTLLEYRCRQAEICFSNQVNLVYGLNAQGKTNLLEAIYLVCLGRSFRGSKNQDLLRKKAPFFTIQGKIKLDNDLKKSVVVHYARDGKKEISINSKRLQSHSSIFGEFPIVVMSPDDYRITTGGPSERRRFFDILLSQVSISYLTNLQEYHRILKQRNKILQQIKEGGGINRSAVEPWTEGLVRVGSKIITERMEFLEEFVRVLKPIYREYTISKDEIEILIESTVDFDEKDGVESRFEAVIQEVNEKERILGISLVGPHRDDFTITINGNYLRSYGSRGEHKSVLISLKIAEFNYLRFKRQERAVFLLDDYYSELDDFREKRVFLSLQDLGQIFLTSPKTKTFGINFGAMGEVSQFFRGRTY